MTTKEFLKDICQNVFGNTYQEEIRNMYSRSVSDGNYVETEREYREGIAYLRSVFDPKDTAILEEYENICTQILEFSSSYGFRAGLLCGFKQFFTNDSDEDGGFTKHVFQRIGMMPNMRTYSDYYKNIAHRNDLYSQLCDGRSEAVHTHMVSLDCAWSQRVYSASINGFYCGYHGAMGIIDEVMPLPSGSAMNSSKTVSMTDWFGFTHPIS